MISVIIPTLNSADSIGYTLSSIFSDGFSGGSFEVLIVDGGSTDDTVEIAKRYPVKVFKCEKPGAGSARNVGMKNARGDILCYTDSDCIVKEQWLDKINIFFRAHPNVDGVGGPVLPYLKSTNKLQKLNGEIFVEDNPFPKEIVKVKFRSFNGVLMDANCAYRKDSLLLVGGFPEPFGWGQELSWRLAARGRTLIFDPEIRVYHIFPSRLQDIFEQQFRWGRGMMELIIRYYGLRNMWGNFLHMPYSMTRVLLSTLMRKDLNRAFLHICQIAVHYLGRIRGPRASQRSSVAFALKSG